MNLELTSLDETIRGRDDIRHIRIHGHNLNYQELEGYFQHNFRPLRGVEGITVEGIPSGQGFNVFVLLKIAFLDRFYAADEICYSLPLYANLSGECRERCLRQLRVSEMMASKQRQQQERDYARLMSVQVACLGDQYFIAHMEDTAVIRLQFKLKKHAKRELIDYDCLISAYRLVQGRGVITVSQTRTSLQRWFQQHYVDVCLNNVGGELAREAYHFAVTIELARRCVVFAFAADGTWALANEVSTCIAAPT